MNRFHLSFLLLTALITAACSSQQPSVKMGTPEFFWSGAKETFAMKDYTKTADHLENLTKTDNQFTKRAYPWRLALLSGLTQGYYDLAEDLESGGNINRGSMTIFRKHINDARQQANRHALQFAEAFESFEKIAKDEKYVIEMPFPGGSPTPSFQSTQIAKGVLKNPADVETAEKKALERAILLATCRMVGAPDDSAKAQQMFQAGSFEVPRATLMTALAGSLYDHGELYVPKKLDQPDRLAFFTKHAMEAMQGLPESKQIKDLTKKIQNREKKFRVKKS